MCKAIVFLSMLNIVWAAEVHKIEPGTMEHFPSVDHSPCATIVHDGSTENTYFVPSKTDSEWQSFYNKAATLASLSISGCPQACSSPTGYEGDFRYDGSAKKPYFCDGSNWVAMVSPTHSRIQTANVSSAVTNTANYSPYVSCEAGATLLNVAIVGDQAATSNSYHYCRCETSGNSLRAYVFGVANPNYICRCTGLCIK